MEYGKRPCDGDTGMQDSSVRNEELMALLRQSANGDSAAFRRLHACSARRLLPFALRIVKSRQLAEDVLQESMVAIWRDAARFDASRAAPLTWMMAIVRNKAFDCLRSNALRERLTDQAVADAAGNTPDPDPGPCELLEQGQSRHLLQRGLTRLALQPREAIELAFFEELTHTEVARKMTTPLGTVKTWIRRGCRQMRHDLERGASMQAGAVR